MGNLPYLYGELNKLVEYLTPEFKSTDGTINFGTIDNNEYKLNLSVNTQNIVQLKQINKDGFKKCYALFAYNSDTKNFDIQLGDSIDISEAGGGINDKFTLKIKIGERDVVDEQGNVIKDDNGNPIKEDIFGNIECNINGETGEIALSQIPSSAIKDDNCFNKVFDGNSSDSGVY